MDRDPVTWPPAPTAGVPSGKPAPPSWLDRLRAAPPELVVFAVFSIVVSLSGLCLTFVGPKPWRDALAPYVGGISFIPYLLCLAVISQLIYDPDARPRVRRGIILILIFSSAFELGTYLLLARLPSNFHSPWQPVWTVALPLAWALVLGLGPALRRRRNAQASV